MTGLLDVIKSPWAIQEEKYLEIRKIYEARINHEKVDFKKLEAESGFSFENKHPNIEIVDSTAIVRLEGVIAKKMNMFTKISGGVSTELAAKDFQAAIDNQEVKNIILHIDSPGGTVDGTEILANLIYNNRDKKNIIGYVSGQACSGACWILSACSETYLSCLTDVVGSIGVVTSHTDYSAFEKSQGVKVTEITAGKYKRIASEHEPLTEEGRKEIESQLNEIYTVFVDSIAKFKGITTEQALAIADGKVFIGQKAVDAGLVDGVSTLPEILSCLKAGAPIGTNLNQEVKNVDLKTLQEEYSELYASVVDTAKAEGLKEGKQEGAKAENQRIKEIKENALAGHEALIESLIADVKTTGAEAAIKILQAEKALQAEAVKQAEKDKVAPVPAIHAEDPGQEKKEKPGEEASVKERAKWDWENDKSVKKDFEALEDYENYLVAFEAGTIKIKGGN